MPQIQLDLPEDVVEEARRQAEARGVSVNHIVAEAVRGGRAYGWPAGFFDEVVGGWQGEPLVRPEQRRLSDLYEALPAMRPFPGKEKVRETVGRELGKALIQRVTPS